MAVAEQTWATRHPVLAEARKALVVAVVLTLAAFLTHKLVPQSAQDSTWAWVGAQQSLSLSHVVWLIVLAAVVAWPVFGLWALIRKHRDRPEPYEAYRTDEFFNLRWRWRWHLGRVIGARAFCRHCDLELDARSTFQGIMDMPTGELRYQCGACGETNVTIQASNPMELAHVVGLCAEREARGRKLLDE